MKKLLSFVLSVLLVLSLAGCGGGEKEKTYEPTAESLTELATDCVSNSSIPATAKITDGNCVVSCGCEGMPYLNEVDIVRKHISAYIKFCLKAYEMDDVSSVTWTADSEMTDTKGNKSVYKVIELRMGKDTFHTYDWEGMEYKKGMFAQFESDCEICNIHPGIIGNVDTENDIFYAP